MFLDVPRCALPVVPGMMGQVTKNDEMLRVGRTVASRRGELGMTQQDLAAEAGVDLKTVYNLEAGARWPIAKNRFAIAVALKWAPDALAAIRDGGSPAPPQSFAPAPEAGPDEIGADERQVWAEVADALGRHGPGAAGAQVFPASATEAGIWDTRKLRNRQEKVQFIAQLRSIASAHDPESRTG